MAAVNLDDLKLYPKADPEGMLARIRELPEQCRRAWRAVMDFGLPADYGDVDEVVICGMGGSAIGGELLGNLVQGECRVPVLVHRDYGLPAHVDGRTLLIASSYSGNTEETISGLEAGLKTGAKKLVITTGGRLQKLAEANGIPVFAIDYRAPPRAAIGYSFIPMLGILQKLGLIGDKAADVAEMIEVLEGMLPRLEERSPLRNNPAKQLSQRLYGQLPVVYGAGIASGVARRWKTQINENSKAWSFHEVFPELNHNAAAGYLLPRELVSRVRVVLLRAPSSGERMRLRYEITCELLRQAGVAHELVDGEGKGALAQMMSLVMMGDFTSYYLAMLYGVDPSPLKVISYLKERLARS